MVKVAQGKPSLAVLRTTPSWSKGPRNAAGAPSLWTALAPWLWKSLNRCDAIDVIA